MLSFLSRWIWAAWFNFKHLFISLRHSKVGEFNDGIEEFFDDLISWPLRIIRKGIWNLYKWFPIIWKDRNFDKDYLLEIIRFKLEMMLDEFKRNGYRADTPDSNKRIEFCIRMIDELTEDRYEELLRKKHDLKYGRLKTYSFVHKVDEMGRPLLYRMEFLRTKVNPRNEALKEEEQRATIEMIEKVERRKERVRKALFGTMARYIDYWWE